MKNNFNFLNINIKLFYNKIKKSMYFAKHYIKNSSINNVSGKYCIGNKLTLVDVCFFPQYHNAINRFDVDKRIFNNLSKLSYFLILIGMYKF